MAHSYRKLQQWNKWLSEQFLGKSLLEAEYQHLAQMLNNHFGKHSLLIGVPHQTKLMNAATIPCKTLISPWFQGENKISTIEANPHDLPIYTGSIDLVFLPHTLEFVDNPRQILTEACRVVKPEGLIVILGFNLFSFWGIKRLLSQQQEMPWNSNNMSAVKVKGWLRLADFSLDQQQVILFRPPINHVLTYQKLSFIEKLGQTFFPFFGNVYIIIARAKVIPLTPIKLQWKQHLSGIRISPTISTRIGHCKREYS